MPASPAAIVAGAAVRGTPVEDWGPVWQAARLRLARASWAVAGLDPFLTFEVPYAATSSGRLSADAVAVALAARPGAQALRVLELGAGSGVFARTFLLALADAAPDIAARCTYVVTDGSAAVLAAQAASGVLDGLPGRIDRRVLDITADFPADLGTFDVIIGTYVLDSLPFDHLVIRDDAVWRREVRCVLDAPRDAQAPALAAALRDPDPSALHPFVGLGPLLGLQTRHVAVDRAALPHADALPRDTGGERLPFVHCPGALVLIDRAAAHLAPGGVLILSDYGHLTPFERHESPEFQTYGLSVATGLNYPQLDARMDALPDLRLTRPASEPGGLVTRVLQRAPWADLSEVVDDCFGTLRAQALSAPAEAARDYLRGRMYETARGLYARLLEIDPRNWALMQEVTLRLLIPAGDWAAADDLTAAALHLNPLAPDLWRARAEALSALGRADEAARCVRHGAALAPGSPWGQMALARLHLDEGDAPAALMALARAFATDRDGDLRDSLLAVQERALAMIAQDQIDLLRAQANALRATDTPP